RGCGRAPDRVARRDRPRCRPKTPARSRSSRHAGTALAGARRERPERTPSLMTDNGDAPAAPSSRPSLLFVARRPPFPLVNGARIRTHRLLTGLARDFETTFVTFEHD